VHLRNIAPFAIAQGSVRLPPPFLQPLLNQASHFMLPRRVSAHRALSHDAEWLHRCARTAPGGSRLRPAVLSPAWVYVDRRSHAPLGKNCSSQSDQRDFRGKAQTDHRRADRTSPRLT
jgi:hypothetical protein